MKALIVSVFMTLALLSAARADQLLTEKQIINVTVPALSPITDDAVKFTDGHATGSTIPDDPYYANDPGMQWHMVVQSVITNSAPAAGKPEAAITIVGDTGGTGWSVTVCSIYNQNGQAVAGPCVEAGEIAVNSVKLDGTKLVVDGDQHGPGDPHCCPSYRRLYTYEVQNNKLVLKSTQDLGRHPQ